MFGKKAARIADLEARLAVAQRPREGSLSAEDAAALTAELRTTRMRLVHLKEQDARKQEAINQLIRRLGEYADRGIANGQRADAAEAELARIRDGGLYRQIRQAANAKLGAGYDDRCAGAIRDFARDLETWIPEDAGKQLATVGPRCVCGDPIQLMDSADPASWIHSPGSDTRCLDARPAADPCAHGCRDAADEHTRLSQELAAGEVAP